MPGFEDLLSFLGVYGQAADCAGYADASWSCGDPVSYQGYDYAIVQIGDQAGLRRKPEAENYRNGDAIPANLSDSEWGATTSGAMAAYGLGSNYACLNTTQNADACDYAWSLNEYGRPYNWYAADDTVAFAQVVGTYGRRGSDLDDRLQGESVAGDQMKLTTGGTMGAMAPTIVAFQVCQWQSQRRWIFLRCRGCRILVEFLLNWLLRLAPLSCNFGPGSPPRFKRPTRRIFRLRQKH